MFTPFSLRQAREFSDTMQAFEGMREVAARQHANRGTLAFRKTNGHDYLVKWAYQEGKRRAKVLGKRSAETEAIERDFNAMRKQLEMRAKSLRANLGAQARLNVATGISRLPLASASILRAFERAGIEAARIKVVGTNALYAYESMAGGIFETGMVATQDIDFPLDPRAPLRFIPDADMKSETLIGILRMADRSFEMDKGSFRASSKSGFMVDIIKPQRNPPWKNDAFEARSEDIQPSPIEGLVWLENAPSIEQPVIDAKGMPVIMHVPDPRVFAIHKYWLSNRAQRGAVKSRRDRAQAFAVASLVMHELKHLPFDGRSLRMMPREVVAEAIAAFRKLPKPDSD